MASTSPLEHEELRHIERTLDDGNTQEAATRLARLGHLQDHQEAIDFLTTRLLFQRGRIDADGAADRVGAILERVSHFPEAEEWLHELEARTERIALAAPIVPAPPGPDFDDLGTITPPPSSRAPSIPRRASASHPFIDESEVDEVTPTDAGRRSLAGLDELRLDSSDPPAPEARPSAPPALGAPYEEETPTRPDASRPPLVRVPDATARATYKPFDSLRAKEQLIAGAGRYRAASIVPEAAPLRESRAPASSVPSEPGRRVALAFGLLMAGRRREAHALIPEEGLPKDAEPDLRLQLARVLLDAGDAERAAAEAKRALDAVPASASARLTFIWSAVRYARQRDDAWSLDRAFELLHAGPLGAAPEPGLIEALGACLEARVGTPALGLNLAQRALRANPQSIDGLAALAESAASTGEERRAELALERLFAISEEAAEQIAPRLRRLGVGEYGPTSSASIWLPLEHTLSSGAREVAVTGLEALAEERLRDAQIGRFEDIEAVARAAADFFTLAPVFRHFGPYDLSLRSIARLDAGLGLLYGPGPRAFDVEGPGHALWRAAGAYLGEALNACCLGRWGGSAVELSETRLEVLGAALEPFQLIRGRIAHGRHGTLRAALSGLLAKAPEAARRACTPNALAPALPWGSDTWPSGDELPRLGRALCHSVVASHCHEHEQTALDRSFASLPALDRYLALVAPATPSVTDAWTRWLCGFAGAYVGEVLCKELGGTWHTTDELDARGPVIRLKSGPVAPLQAVFDALSAAPTGSLAQWVEGVRASNTTRSE